MIRHEHGPLCVDAGPGSGKTCVIVERAIRLSNRYGSEYVALFSYTKTAATELIHRFRKMTDEIPLITTIHAWSWSICRSVRPDLQVADERISQEILKEITNASEDTAAKYLSAIAAHKNGASFASKHGLGCADFDQVRKEYDRVLRQRKLVDFADMLVMGLEALRQSPRLLQLLHRRFRHVMIDEFQDTNAIQYLIVRSVVEGRVVSDPNEISHFTRWNDRSFVVVGDSDQCIYGFRAASSRLIIAFANHFPNAESILLKDNFRCSQEVVDLANGVIAFNQRRRPKRLSAAKGYNGWPVEIFGSADPEDEADEIAARISEIIQLHPSWDVAVLCRRNRQAEAIARRLTASGLRIRRSTCRPIAKLPEFKQVLGLLKLAVDPADSEALNDAVSVDSLRRKILAAMDRHQCDAATAISILRDQGNSSARALHETITEMADALWGDGYRGSPLQRALVLGFERTAWLRRLLCVGDGCDEDRIGTILRVIDGARGIDSHFVAKFEELLTALDGMASIKLTTIHGAKGCEHDAVFVVGLDDGIFPDRSSDIEEERRLLYVALTRAKQKLSLSFTVTDPGLFVGDVVVNLPVTLKGDQI